jgi:hypothetical protein
MLCVPRYKYRFRRQIFTNFGVNVATGGHSLRVLLRFPRSVPNTWFVQTQDRQERQVVMATKILAKHLKAR